MPEQHLYVGIGNAAIDVVCSVSEEQLLALKLGVTKASCAFLNLATTDQIEKTLQDWGVECHYFPGGSAANTASMLGALGASCAFIGKIANDPLGELFKSSLALRNVAYDTAPVADGVACTTRLFAFITPDGERTFAVYHGTSDHLQPSDADEALIGNAKILYVDGYMLASKNGYPVTKAAMAIAKKHNVPAFFNPSALSVIDGWRSQVDEIIGAADGIICNEEEATYLTGTGDARSALEALAGDSKFACVTAGANGAWARQDGVSHHAPVTTKDVRIVNTNGAGDGFAGGFLYGYLQGWSLDRTMNLGIACGIHVLGQTGARCEGDLSGLLKQV